jgi:ParB-like chromosome segregation protein Spo0J
VKKQATATRERGIIEIAIADLIIPFYVRQKLNPDHVLFLAEMMEGGIDIDPIVIVANADGTYSVRDGRHRMEASKLLDRPVIKARVVPPAKDQVQEIKLAFEANAGGALPPSREDIEHTVRLLLSQGVARKEIAKILPIPVSLAHKYVQSVNMKQLRARMRQAVEAVSEGTLNAPHAAEKFRVDLEALRRELGGRKKRAKHTGAEVKRIVSSKYRSLAQYNASVLKRLFIGLEDGETSVATIETALKTMSDLNRKLGVNVQSWRDRLKQAQAMNGKLADVKDDE